MKNCWQLQRRDCLTISVVAPQEVRVDAAVASFILELGVCYNIEEARTAPKAFLQRKQSTNRLWWDLPACSAGGGTLVLLIWSVKLMKSYIYQLQMALPSSTRGQCVLNPIPILLCVSTAASEYKMPKFVPKNVPWRINKATNSPSLTTKSSFEKRKTNPESFTNFTNECKGIWPAEFKWTLTLSISAGRKKRTKCQYLPQNNKAAGPTDWSHQRTIREGVWE